MGKVEIKEVRGLGIFQLNDMSEEGWKPDGLTLDKSMYKTWSGLMYREVSTGMSSLEEVVYGACIARQVFDLQAIGRETADEGYFDSFHEEAQYIAKEAVKAIERDK